MDKESLVATVRDRLDRLELLIEDANSVLDNPNLVSENVLTTTIRQLDSAELRLYHTVRPLLES